MLHFTPKNKKFCLLSDLMSGWKTRQPKGSSLRPGLKTYRVNTVGLLIYLYQKTVKDQYSQRLPFSTVKLLFRDSVSLIQNLNLHCKGVSERRILPSLFSKKEKNQENTNLPVLAPLQVRVSGRDYTFKTKKQTCKSDLESLFNSSSLLAEIILILRLVKKLLQIRNPI